MTQENVSDLLWVDTQRLGGRVCFAGTRLSFFDFVNRVVNGAWTMDDLRSDYPYITDEQWALVERELPERFPCGFHIPNAVTTTSPNKHKGGAPLPYLVGENVWIGTQFIEPVGDDDYDDDTDNDAPFGPVV